MRNPITGVQYRGLKLGQALKSDSLRARFARGAIWSFAGALISQGLTLIASIVTARLLGKVGFGQLGMVNSTVGMFGTFAGFGLGMTTTKYVAEFRTADPVRAGRIIALTTSVAAASAALFALILIGFAQPVATATLAAPQLILELRIGALLLFFNTINGVQTGTLSGFEAFKGIAVSNLIKGIFSFPVLVGGVLLWGLPGAVLGLVLASGIGCLANRIILHRQCRRYGIAVTFAGMWKENTILKNFAVPAFLANAAMGPVTWVANTMLVNQKNGYAELGVFNAAYQWRVAMLFLPGLIGQVVLPMLSSLQGERHHHSTRRVVLGAIVLNALFTLPVLLPILFLSNRIMGLYGQGFASQGRVLVITAFTAALYAVETPVGDIIAASGRMWIGAYMNLGWAAALLCCNWFLLQQGWGAEGLATAYLIAYALLAIWTFWVAAPALAKRIVPNNESAHTRKVYEEIHIDRSV